MQSDNQIVLKGATYNELKQALNQWINLYEEDLNDDIKFKLIKIHSDEFVLKVDDSLDNERFFFLINYLKYPEDIKYKVDVIGYTIGKDKNLFEANKLLVYIPENDDEYDNVYVVMEDNSTFKVGFNGAISEQPRQKSYTAYEQIEYFNSEIIKVNKNEIKKTKTKEYKQNLNNRFQTIIKIILSVFVLGIITSYFYRDLLEKFIFFFGYGLCCWFFVDYKMLQINRCFNINFFISIVFLGIMLLTGYVSFEKTNLLLMGVMSPTLFLIVQKIARLTFIQILKREPIPEKPSPSVADFIYTMVLIISFALMPIFMSDFF